MVKLLYRCTTCSQEVLVEVTETQLDIVREYAGAGLLVRVPTHSFERADLGSAGAHICPAPQVVTWRCVGLYGKLVAYEWRDE
jgi:DNA-directed RNA polymerase subunit RPC12/RpoP